MLAQEIIRIKRNGGSLDAAQIQDFVRGLTDGSWSEGQSAALAMAVYFQGMSMDERIALTRAMMNSGAVMDWAGEQLPGPVLDKHSTGGVGDKVSLILAPLLAACGAYVPMISGRGLGHTGGTLDKFDSLAGYQTAPSLALLKKTVRQAGCAVIGQTGDLAPADRRLYGIRDVTATVESVPLITASILSKKLAAGLQGLVMDVKVGNGAFAAQLDMARELAASLLQVANGAGLPTRVWITDMNQVLGHSCGNAVEMAEAITFLTGKLQDKELAQVIEALAVEALLLGRLATSAPHARQQLQLALSSGRAAEHFARMVTLLGGRPDVLQHPERSLTAAPVQRSVKAPHGGWLAGMQTRDIGILLIELGGGRRQASDVVDHRVGITGLKKVGAPLHAGEVIATIHAASEAAAEQAEQRLLAALQISEQAVAELPVLLERLSDSQ